MPLLEINWRYYRYYLQYHPELKDALIFLLLIIVIIIIIRKLRPLTPLSNWHHNFGNFQFSTQDFYVKVEEELKKRELPDVSFSRVLHSQGGIFSAKREYLRVSRLEFVFDICAAPYGTGFFTSWWFADKGEGILSKVPIVNSLLGINRKKKSYYQLDTESMFRSAVHSAVMATVEEITSSKGIRKLTELESQPKLGKHY